MDIVDQQIKATKRAIAGLKNLLKTLEKKKISKKSPNDRIVEAEMEAEKTMQGSIINGLIADFKPINPSYERFYPNKYQREALERLVAIHGEEQLRAIILFLQKTNGKRFAPKITDPLGLEKKIGLLKAYCDTIKDTSLSNKKGKEIIGL